MFGDSTEDLYWHWIWVLGLGLGGMSWVELGVVAKYRDVVMGAGTRT